MKKLLLIASTVAMSFSLAGCGTTGLNDTTRFAGSTVGTGVKYTTNTVGTGVRYVGQTGVAVGRGVGNIVSGGLGWIARPFGYHQKTISYKGHQYINQNGQYVRVN